MSSNSLGAMAIKKMTLIGSNGTENSVAKFANALVITLMVVFILLAVMLIVKTMLALGTHIAQQEMLSFHQNRSRLLFLMKIPANGNHQFLLLLLL